MLLCGVLARLTIRNTSTVSSVKLDSFDSLVTSLSKKPKFDSRALSFTELEKIVDENGCSASERLSYIISLPSNPDQSQIQRIRNDRFSEPFSNDTVKIDELVSASDKLCKLNAADTTTFGKLIDILQSVSISSFNKVSLCSLVEVLCSCIEKGLIKNDKWMNEVKNVVSSLMKESDISDIIFVLRRSDIWNDDAIQTLKNNFTSIQLFNKLSLLNVLSKKENTDILFINILVNEIANDKQELSLRQCMTLVNNCMDLNVKDARLKTKLIEEIKIAMGSMDKWSDARTIITLFNKWRIPDNDIWNQLGAWTGRRADKAPFKDLSVVVSMFVGMGRDEGATCAIELKKRLSREEAGSARIWLQSIHSLAYYSLMDKRMSESVLNHVFIQELFKELTNGKRHIYQRMLLQINEATCIELKEYQGPTLPNSFISPEEEKTWIEMTHTGSYLNDINAFRSCISRIIVDPSHSKSQLHSSGIVIEGIVPKKDGVDDIIVFVVGNRLAVNGDDERLLGNDRLSIRLMEKKGHRVIVFTSREMATCQSEVEATSYIRKKIYS